MSEATTDKRIDLHQLTSELGGAPLSARTEGGLSVIAAAVPQAALDAAIAAHVAPDLVLQSANDVTIRQRVNASLATNATFLAVPTPTNAQIAAQVKALTRQNDGLIRLLLRRFDGTD